ncbi:MAG TPA: hypothetical protein VD837_02110 [Terriglobales bacterium]|nr:hypothetical protein [Terriglobales bacterium]
MAQGSSRLGKIAVAIFCGLLVGVVSAGVHIATIPLDRTIMLHVAVGDFIAALTAIIVCLGIQLRQEEIHYQNSIERAAIVAELNHHIRNAVFPLCLAIQKTGDADSMKTAQEAVDRINIALKDATVDALSGRTQYSTDRNAVKVAE